MNKTFQIVIDDNTYLVIVTYKHSRTISYRFKDNKFVVYCPYLTSLKQINDGLNKYGLKLIKHSQTKTGISDDYVYIFGNKYNLDSSRNIILDNLVIHYDNKNELISILNKLLLDYVTKRTKEYEAIMGSYSNKVFVRNMSTRYGSNTPSLHRIRYASLLIYYSKDIIDSVIVHELCHCFFSGHNKKFYDLVYKYCPNYKLLNKKLKEGEFSC